MSRGSLCSQADCKRTALWEYDWPGRGTHQCCEVHREQVENLSEHMGWGITLRVIETFHIRIARLLRGELTEIPTEKDVMLWFGEMVLEVEELRKVSKVLEKPVDMLLWCPKCHTQHVDKPEPERNSGCAIRYRPAWDNPPHRTHRCGECGHEWRPALIHTNGVESL